MSQTVNAGIVTAYGAAVRGGYQGTYSQFCEDLASMAQIIGDLTDLSAVAQTLAAGASATASYEDGVISIGIPKGDKGDTGDKGDKGDTGATPELSIGTVTTGAAGSSAAASITGTAEEPVLNLTIPKGDPGEVPAAAIASTQASTTASKLIAEGEYFWLSGSLYIATEEIASGGTIVTSGTGANCELAKVGDDLTSQSRRIETLEGLQPKRLTLSLLSDGWTNNAQTVTATGVSATETAQVIDIIPAAASQGEYVSCGVYCDTQGTNSLTFKYLRAPTSNLTVYAVITEVTA